MRNEELIKHKKSISISLFVVLCSLLIFLLISCAGMAISAEEYFSIGMAYYDLGKYEDAEKWLTRARQADKTFTASQYNLGRIAFERNRLEDAAKLFEDILKKDPVNILALRAAAYTRIKMADIENADKHYSKLLELIPESSDDGYNHALVLFAMERYGDAEDVLAKYPFALQENKDIQLLHARAQGRQNKVEAIESFSAWLVNNSDPKARYEYALVLEYHEFYARALEELRKALSDSADNAADPKKNEIRFAIARVLLIAESDNNSGVTELQEAVKDGYSNIDAIEELLSNNKISNLNKNDIRSIIDNIRREALAAEEKKKLEEEEAKAIREAALEAEQTEENVSETDSETGSE